jgi:putative cell wall binding repeat protein
VGLALGGCGKSLSGTKLGVETTGRDGASGLATANTTRLGGANAVLDAAAVARAVYPGLTDGTRPRAVVLVDERNWPAALAASVLAGAPLHAPILYTEGDSLPSASAQALADMRPTGVQRLGYTQVITISSATSPDAYRRRAVPAGEAARVAGAIERLAVRASGVQPRDVIIASSDAPAALEMPAAGLSAQTGAPILLVNARTIPAATRVVLRRLGQPRIYIVGPTGAVSQRVAEELRRYGRVARINGGDASSNAVAVARFSDGSFGWGVEEPGHGLVFTTASRPLDAPATAVLSASGDYAPLLLLDAEGRIPGELAAYLRGIQPGYTSEPQYRPVHGVYNHGWVIGDERAISPATQAELDSLLEITKRPSPPGNPPATSEPQEFEQ